MAPVADQSNSALPAVVPDPGGMLLAAAVVNRDDSAGALPCGPLNAGDTPGVPSFTPGLPPL